VRRTPHVQVVGAICINISENDQGTVRRFWGDGYSRRNAMHDSRQVETRLIVTICRWRLCHYDLFETGAAAARLSLKPWAFAYAGLAEHHESVSAAVINVDFSRALCRQIARGMWRRATGERRGQMR